MQGVVDDKLGLGAHLPVIPGLELPVLHMVVLHPHKGGLGICLAVAAPSRQDFLLLFVLVQVLWEVLLDIAKLGLCLGGGLGALADDLLYFLYCFLHLFLIDLLEVRRCGIAVLLIGNALCILPHRLQLLRHFLFARLDGVPPRRRCTYRPWTRSWCRR